MYLDMAWHVVTQDGLDQADRSGSKGTTAHDRAEDNNAGLELAPGREQGRVRELTVWNYEARD